MVDYLYDGSFEGLLTCIYHHYYTEKADGIYPKEEYQGTMLAGYKEVTTEEAKAATVYSAIEKKISTSDLRRIYKVYCSTVNQKETKILRYILLGFQRGSCIRLLHGNSTVVAVQEAEQKVNMEIHRLSGLIRFSELSNFETSSSGPVNSGLKDRLMYSTIEPDHDMVEFLADHFCDRFKSQPFIIHDVKRNKALIAYERQWYITDFTKEHLPDFSQEEQTYRKLWKHYFENIAIKQRFNPRCQKTMMPVRYWKHLPEFLENESVFQGGP